MKSLSVRLLASRSSAWLLLMSLGSVDSLCVRTPNVECAPLYGSVEEEQACDGMLTCQPGNLDSVGNLRCIDSIDVLETATQCEDLSEEKCPAQPDCLWVAPPTTPQGPFAAECNPRSFVNVPGSTTKLGFALGDPCLASVDDLCGSAASADALGQWITLRSYWDGPIRLSTLGSEFDTVLSVFAPPADAAGQLTCLTYNNDVNDGSSTTALVTTTHSEVVFEARADEFYYALVTLQPNNNNNNNTASSTNATLLGAGDSPGRMTLTARPATAAAACDYQCGRADATLGSCTCVTHAPDQTVSAVTQDTCERCHPTQGFCLVESGTTVYTAHGAAAETHYCYRLTSGFANETICTTFSAAGEATGYTVNEAPCTTIPNAACADSATFDCAAIVAGAVFDWCDYTTGYVGIFAADPYFDPRFYNELVAGECLGSTDGGGDDGGDDGGSGSGSGAPTGAPTGAPSAGSMRAPAMGRWVMVLIALCLAV
jgi:hypothetical protein